MWNLKIKWITLKFRSIAVINPTAKMDKRNAWAKNDGKLKVATTKGELLTEVAANDILLAQSFGPTLEELANGDLYTHIANTHTHNASMYTRTHAQTTHTRTTHTRTRYPLARRTTHHRRPSPKKRHSYRKYRDTEGQSTHDTYTSIVVLVRILTLYSLLFQTF